ncbi:phage head closure protein [Ralstonia pseudosolanacearum]|uniref:Phage head-tail joining protein n=2 Tax=Ralstonia syzygii subsp. celebesensis TaxID=1310168 RepID=A0A1U9VHJ4_9RALS|nr:MULTISPECIES: phage head closure protein [Ralstonia solanacearum species complex]AKZ26331.1 nucleoid-structuring protein H-NS [Ralstonia solanacearum]CCA79912.1 putative phage head-tail adaptor [blood disease bacterium R229]API74696.1 phage head-tail joining protein [Ralstonia pseudosolanacearum]AQW29531.1 phage head-tail joining protein [blood disease bacterium A2-HR MARDI]MCK4127098.1 phage head closure protein [Ralstonia pseudosolanacearum]
MQRGKYNRRIVLQRREAGRAPSGQPINAWVDVARPWARVRGENGKEFIVADRETAESDVSLRIRYRTDVTAAWRVIYRGQPCDIKAVLPDEVRRQHVDLVVTIGASKG